MSQFLSSLERIWMLWEFGFFDWVALIRSLEIVNINLRIFWNAMQRVFTEKLQIKVKC